ncbi:hypothetical protein B0T17DRAFT_250949 [Bombardia bombarda]|uniref:Uncharacterized protein n=1 Tax=Bombardia bombarda TaxID=252184 RepID=A0AA40C455_9PEZI|nr:hypothetical protein B0T17DRAFT_250949 [Bombardia bombarda]
MVLLDGDDREDVLYESAMARIRRAQAKGKTEVKLSKEELAAIERRRRRMEGEERRKRREQRFAVPLSQLEPVSRKKRRSLPDDSLPQRQSPTTTEGKQQPVYPPMGYFPPPSSSRAPRPRSGTSSSRSSGQSGRTAIDREQSSSPFSYSYVDHAASARHSSDPAAGRPRSQASMPNNYSSPSASAPMAPEPLNQSQNQMDPFQYMTAGARASYHAGNRPARQSVLGPPADVAFNYGTGPLPRGGPPPPSAAGRAVRTQSKEEPSSEEQTSSEESEDDDIRPVPPKVTNPGHVARLVNSVNSNRGQPFANVAAAPQARPAPPPEPEPRRLRRGGKEAEREIGSSDVEVLVVVKPKLESGVMDSRMPGLRGEGQKR